MQPPRSDDLESETLPACDREVRALLKLWLERKHAGERDMVVLEELGLLRRRVRADVVVVNGRLHGYEIKAARDDLNRLPRQVPVYSEVFDRATLVVDSRHFAKAKRLVPEWWEILTIGASGFRTEQRGRSNPSRKPRTLVEFVWRDDALALLERKDSARGLRRSPRHRIWDRVCELYSIEEIAVVVRERLKARSTNAAD